MKVTLEDGKITQVHEDTPGTHIEWSAHKRGNGTVTHIVITEYPTPTYLQG